MILSEIEGKKSAEKEKIRRWIFRIRSGGRSEAAGMETREGENKNIVSVVRYLLQLSHVAVACRHGGCQRPSPIVNKIRFHNGAPTIYPSMCRTLSGPVFGAREESMPGCRTIARIPIWFDSMIRWCIRRWCTHIPTHTHTQCPLSDTFGIFYWQMKWMNVVNLNV